jgi:DNA-directed RNA polymerase specialized sigma24 family protein
LTCNAFSRGDRQLFEDYLEGFPIEEIARKQGISYTAVRIRLLRARRGVQSRIKGGDGTARDSRLKSARACRMAA